MSLRTAYPTFYRLLGPSLRPLAKPGRVVLHLITFRWWSWRLTRRLLFTGAALVTLLALAYAVENWRGRRAFAAVLREAAEAGVSFDLSAHALPPVPDAQNLARHPLFDAPAEPEARARFWDALRERIAIQRSETHEPQVLGSSALPDTGRPVLAQNKAADLDALRAEMTRQTAELGDEDLDTYLARLAPLLAELGAAAEERPYLRHDYDWEDPYSIIVPHVGLFRGLAQISVVQSLVALERGRPAEAAQALALPLRLRAAAQQEPMLISVLTAVAIGHISISALWQGQLTHAWTDAELDRFATLLAEERYLAQLYRAYSTEAAWSVNLPLQLPQTLSRHPDTFAGDSDEFPFNLFAFWLPSGWRYQNAATAGRHHLRCSLPSVDPVAERVYPERVKPIDRSAGFSPYESIARILLPEFSRIGPTVGFGKTTHDLARLAVALEKHLLAHGAYPDSLAPILAASPELAALHDPFDGQPYRYRREADGGFTLWGVGQNLRDDGGAFPEIAAPSERPDYQTGDVVWRVPGR